MKNFNKERLLHFTPNSTTCIALAKDLGIAWSDIQDLIMAKAIGLHRIIGHISKAKEKCFRKKENNLNAIQVSVTEEIDKNLPSTCTTAQK